MNNRHPHCVAAREWQVQLTDVWLCQAQVWANSFSYYPFPAPAAPDGGRSEGGESRQPSLGYLHVLAVMAAADADPADHRVPWGSPMKSTNSANVGNSCIAAAGVPARAISCSIRRMAPVAASNVLMGKITIRYPSSFTRSRLIGGVLPLPPS